MRRFLALAPVLVVAVLVQPTVLARLTLAGVRADLLVLAVVSVAVATDPTTGAVFGFVAGLVADLLFDLPVGVSALVYTAVGFAVGTGRVDVTRHRPPAPPAPRVPRRRGQPGLGVVLRAAAAGVRPVVLGDRHPRRPAGRPLQPAADPVRLPGGVGPDRAHSL